MTAESGAGADDHNKQNPFDAKPEGDAQGRKVAKTMLDGQIPQLPDTQEPPESSDEQDITKPSKRLAKTKLEMNRPTAEQIIAASDAAAVEQEQSPGKVTKTQIEITRPELSAIQEAAIAAANEAPDSKRTVPKTQLEISRPDLSGIEIAKSDKAAQEQPKKTAKTMMEMSLPASSDTAKQVKKVSRTMLDVNTLDAIGMAKAIKQERANVPVKVRKTLTRDQALPSLTDVNNALNAAAAANADTVVTASNTDADTVVSAANRDIATTIKTEDSIKKAKKRPRGTESFVAKTMLDHSVLSMQVMKSHEKEKVKAAYIAQERANDPVSDFQEVDSNKMASPCAWSWNGPSGNKGRVKACERCQTQVYDFSGMELPEAEALIYKQESKKRFTLFKRADGKFMTVDCPVQVQRKRNLVLLCVVGALVMISVVALMILMPPAKPPVAKTQEPAPAAVQTKNSASTNQSPTTSSDFFPAVVGDPTPRLTSTPATPNPSTTAPAKATDSASTTTTTATGDQDSKYWDGNK